LPLVLKRQKEKELAAIAFAQNVVIKSSTREVFLAQRLSVQIVKLT